nr:hypothetical protein [Rosenbergiella australiborealis]
MWGLTERGRISRMMGPSGRTGPRIRGGVEVPEQHASWLMREMSQIRATGRRTSGTNA